MGWCHGNFVTARARGSCRACSLAPMLLGDVAGTRHRSLSLPRTGRGGCLVRVDRGGRLLVGVAARRWHGRGSQRWCSAPGSSGLLRGTKPWARSSASAFLFCGRFPLQRKREVRRESLAGLCLGGASCSLSPRSCIAWPQPALPLPSGRVAALAARVAAALAARVTDALAWVRRSARSGQLPGEYRRRTQSAVWHQPAPLVWAAVRRAMGRSGRRDRGTCRVGSAPRSAAPARRTGRSAHPQRDRAQGIPLHLPCNPARDALGGRRIGRSSAVARDAAGIDRRCMLSRRQRGRRWLVTSYALASLRTCDQSVPWPCRSRRDVPAPRREADCGVGLLRGWSWTGGYSSLHEDLPIHLLGWIRRTWRVASLRRLDPPRGFNQPAALATGSCNAKYRCGRRGRTLPLGYAREDATSAEHHRSTAGPGYNRAVIPSARRSRPTTPQAPAA